MQPFSVICETCQARLKVLSESAIGQIVSCPKCGSMVQISAPAEWSVGGPEPVATGFEPLPQPPLNWVERLMQPMALLAGASIAIVAATLAVVLASRGPAEVDKQPVAIVPADARPASEPAAEIPAEAPPAEVAAATEQVVPSTTASPLPQSTPETTQPEPTNDAPEARQHAVTEPDPLGFDVNTFNVEVPEEDEPATPLSKTEPSEVEAAKAAKPPASGLAANSSLADSQSAVRLGPISSGAVRARDPKAQLALPVDSYEATQAPLDELVGSISDMAAVPVTLDPSALAMAGVAANQPVTLRAQQTTLAGLLADALARHGLAYKIEDGQLIVVKPGAERRRSVDYELKDLVGQGADTAELAKLIEQAVAPGSWQSAGGSGTIAIVGTSLTVEQDGRVHNQILTFCERLRLARGLPTRSRYPAERLAIAPVYSQLQARLATPATFTFLPWTPLAEMFRHWQEAAGVRVLVDWSALAQEELGPTTPVAASVVEEPWSAAFDAVLTPIGLTWWAVDGQTIEITTRVAAANVQQVEFYAVDEQTLAQYPSPAALVAELERGLAAKSADTQAGESRWFLSFDEPSGRLIVRGSPDVQRHLDRLLRSSAVSEELRLNRR